MDHNHLCAFEDDDRKENRTDKRLHLDSPSGILSPANKIPLKKPYRLSAPLESRMGTVVNIADPNLESTLLESTSVNTDLKIGDTNLEATAIEETICSFNTNFQTAPRAENLELAAAEASGEITESASNEIRFILEKEHKQNSDSQECDAMRLLEHMDSNQSEIVDLPRQFSGSGDTPVGKDFYPNVIRDMKEEVTIRVTNTEALQVKNETKSQAQMDKTPVDTVKSDLVLPPELTENATCDIETVADVDVPKLLEAKKKGVSLDRVNPPSTPRSLEQYARERVSDYSFMISEAFCENDVFCENCYKMRVELEKLADQFSGVIFDPTTPRQERNADWTSIQHLEEALSSANESIAKRRGEMQMEIEKLKENLAEVERQKEFAKKDLEDYKFCMERELQKVKEDNRQKIVEICELNSKIGEMQEAENVLYEKALLREDFEAKLEALMKEKLTLEEKVGFLETEMVSNDKMEALKGLLAETEKTLNEKQDEMALVQKENSSLKEKLDEAQGMQAQLEDIVKTLEEEKEALLTDLVNLEERADSSKHSDSLRTELSFALSKVTALEEQLELGKQESNRLGTELANKVNEIRAVSGSLLEVEERLASVEKEKQQLCQTNSELRCKVLSNEQNAAHIEEMKGTLSAALTPYLTRLDSLHEESLAVKEENSALKEKIKFYDCEKTKLNEYLERIREENHLLNSKIATLEKSTVNIAEHEAIRGQLQLLEEKAKIFEESSSQWKEQLVTLKDELVRKSEEVEQLSVKKRDLEGEVLLTASKMKHLDAENTILKEKAFAEKELTLPLKQMEAFFEEKLMSLASRLNEEKNNEEVISLKQKNKNLEEMIQTLEQDVLKCKAQLDTAEEDKLSLNVKLCEMERNCIDTADYNVVKNSLSSWQSKVSELEQVIMTLRSEAQILKDALSAKAEEVEKALLSKKELAEQLSALSRENEKLVELNKAFKDSVQSKDEELLRIEESRRNTEVEFTSFKEKAAQAEELTRRVGYLEKENKRLGDACDDADEEITQLRQSLFDVRRKLASVEGIQQGLSKEEIMAKLGCIDFAPQSSSIDVKEEDTKKADCSSVTFSEGVVKKSQVVSTEKDFTPVSSSTQNLSPSFIKTSSAKKQKSEQCRQQ